MSKKQQDARYRATHADELRAKARTYSRIRHARIKGDATPTPEQLANNPAKIPWPGRFWANTTPTPSGCVEWAKHINRDGYGRVWVPPLRRVLNAHRVAFALAFGREPTMELDHICRNRRCVNPDHLREASRLENAANGRWAMAVACMRGHAWDEVNTYWYKGSRNCRACHRAGEAARKKNPEVK